jgi:hypothetical protein
MSFPVRVLAFVAMVSTSCTTVGGSDATTNASTMTVAQTGSGQAPGSFLVLQRNERAWTFDETGAIDGLGGVEAQDIDPNGRIVALRPDPIWYTPPGTSDSISFFRRDGVLVIDAETGASVVLAEAAPDETFDGPARWSPDGRTIALWVVSYAAPLPKEHPGNSGDPAVCLLSVDDGSRTCFPQAGKSVSLDWSPDGRRLLVAGLDGPVSVLNPDTGHVTPIIDPSGGAHAAALLQEHGLGHVIALQEAAWSPTGRYVAVHASVVPGRSTVIIYSAEGEALAIASASDAPEPFAWSPAADVLAYVAADASPATRGPNAVHLLDPSGDDRRVVDLAVSGDWGVASITWSPDGGSLALNTSDDAWVVDPFDGATSLRRLDTPGAVVAWG